MAQFLQLIVMNQNLGLGLVCGKQKENLGSAVIVWLLAFPGESSPNVCALAFAF